LLSPLRAAQRLLVYVTVARHSGYPKAPLPPPPTRPLMRAAIVVDNASSIPLHRQIYEAWRRGILAGRFRQGDRVPSSRELAQALRVSRSTVTQAYEQLFAEGYLETAHGSGTFVRGDLHDHTLPAPATQRTKTASPTIRLSAFGAKLKEDFPYASQPSDHICFSRWTPDVERFPLEIWRKLLNRHLQTPARAMLDYAQQAQGYEPLRKEIAAYVARSRAVHCTPEQVLILNGSQQALELCARVLCDAGDVAGFEDPGYLGTRRIFEAAGVALRPARVDEQGIVVSTIAKQARVVYVTPSHQFPTGVAMSLARRLELLAWARHHRAVIVEDDYDSEYRYSGPPLPALQGLAQDVPVVYCGTFSKVMFPALRIGYAVLPDALVAPFRRAKWLCDRSTPAIEQAALTDFIADGHLERHIRRMRRLYGDRRQVLVESLQRHFADRINILGEAAGMHLALRTTDAGFADRARRSKVQIVSTRHYYLSKPRKDEFLLGFSSLSERSIREGIRRLAPTA
jgi:GntR family transcriptional regulator/MocR family aminotransferase